MYKEGVNALLLQDRINSIVHPVETEDEKNARNLKEPLYEEIDNRVPNKKELNKNSENVRQVGLKIHRTSEGMMKLFDDARQTFRTNI